MTLLEKRTSNVTKTDLIAVAVYRYYPGYRSREFISKSKEINKAFDSLVAEGIIEYTARKPLSINTTLQEESSEDLNCRARE